jgi:hypothetical protein
MAVPLSDSVCRQPFGSWSGKCVSDCTPIAPRDWNDKARQHTRNAIAELQGGQNLKPPGGLHTAATFYHPVAGATMANHETFTLNTLVSTPPAPPPPPPPPLPRMRSCASLESEGFEEEPTPSCRRQKRDAAMCDWPLSCWVSLAFCRRSTTSTWTSRCCVRHNPSLASRLVAQKE